MSHQSFVTQDEAVLALAKVGDIVQLDGRTFRVTKKTNYNAAIEPYTLIDRIEDFILDKLGRL